MPLHLYPNIYVSSSAPAGWTPTRSGTIKYPARNPAVRRYLRQLLPGRWQKVINTTLSISKSGFVVSQFIGVQTKARIETKQGILSWFAVWDQVRNLGYEHISPDSSTEPGKK